MAELLADAADLVDTIAGDAVTAAAEAARERLRALAPRVVRPAITIRTEGDGIDTVATVHVGGLTPVIVQGARRHVIMPLRRRALNRAGGRHPFARAEHPGTAPNDFITRAESAIGDEVDAVGEAALDELIDAMDRELEQASA